MEKSQSPFGEDQGAFYIVKKRTVAAINRKFFVIRSKFGSMQPIVHFSKAAASSDEKRNSWTLRSEAFRLTWSNFVSRVEKLLHESLNPAIAGVLEFIDRFARSSMPEVPTCFALAGINVADHTHVFNRLILGCREKQTGVATRQIAILQAQACPSVLQAVSSIVAQFEGKYNVSLMLTHFTATSVIGQSTSSWSTVTDQLLHWYRLREAKVKELLLLKESNKAEKKYLPLVIILEDTECFSPSVICGLVNYCHYLRTEYQLPVVLIWGISFSSRFLELLCDPNVFRKLYIEEIEIFNSKQAADKLFNLLLQDPFTLPFMVSGACISALRLNFDHYNLCFSTILKSMYCICLDFYSNQPFSFLARPIDDLFSPLSVEESSKALEKDPTPRTNVSDMKTKFALLLISTNNYSKRKRMVLNVETIALLMERKYALNLAVLFDTFLALFQKEVGETARERDIVRMTPKDTFKYIDNCASLVAAQYCKHRTSIITLLKRIEASFHPVCIYLSEICRDCKLEGGEKKDYTALLQELRSLIDTLRREEKDSLKQQLIGWVRVFLQSLLSGPNIVNSFLFWEKDEIWLEKCFCVRPNISLINQMVDYTEFSKLTRSPHTLENDRRVKRKDLSLVQDIDSLAISKALLLSDLGILYVLYESYGGSICLWDWFCCFCNKINLGKLEFHPSQLKAGGPVPPVSRILHLRFAIALSTFSDILGFVSINAANAHPATVELLIDSQETADLTDAENHSRDHQNSLKANSKVFSRKKRSENVNLRQIHRRLVQFRAKKLHWGKLISDGSDSILDLLDLSARKKQKLHPSTT